MSPARFAPRGLPCHLPRWGRGQQGHRGATGHFLERAGSHAQSFWKPQKEKKLCPLPLPFSLCRPSRPGPPFFSLWAESLFSPFLLAPTQFACLPFFLVRLSFLFSSVSSCCSAYFSCSPSFSRSISSRLSLFTLSPFSSPRLAHLPTGCLLFPSLHCLWSWVCRLLSPLPTPAMTRQCPPP